MARSDIYTPKASGPERPMPYFIKSNLAGRNDSSQCIEEGGVRGGGNLEGGGWFRSEDGWIGWWVGGKGVGLGCELD